MLLRYVYKFELVLSLWSVSIRSPFGFNSVDVASGSQLFSDASGPLSGWLRGLVLYSLSHRAVEGLRRTAIQQSISI